MKRLLMFALIACPLSIYAETCETNSVCQQGDTVRLISKKLKRAEVTLANVTLGQNKATGTTFETPLLAEAPDRPELLSFEIPKDLPDGTYLIQIKQTPKPTKEAPAPEAKAIDDLSPSQVVVQRPAISAVSPAAAFLDDHGVHRVTVMGNGFRKASTFQFNKIETPAPCAKGAPDAQKKDCYELNADDERQITLSFRALDPSKGYYDGPHEFAIRVDGIVTNSSSFALINTTSGMPMTVAVIGIILIVVIIFLLVLSGKKLLKQRFGSKTYFLSVLFLDLQTCSYSLSKCQFYAWTVAAVFGYIFLAISKSYVQGSATFPDIPAGLPGILLASAGAAVLSTGIASAKGDKGAGSPEPRLSDFITTGGVVAADRLQFAVWTVVGIGTFLAIIGRSDPRNITDLPSIPSGFLQLMGISVAGYLAGKVARKPGPTLDAIAISSPADTVKHDPEKLTFQLTGMGLSQSALFSIDGSSIYPDTIQGKDPGSKLPEVVQQDPTIGDPQYARVLRFTCTQPRNEWLGGPHSFTITNPDVQKASVSFQIFKVTEVKITATDITITGECLDDKLKVKYMKQGGQPADAVEPRSTAPNQYTAKVTGLQKDNLVTVTIADTSGVVVYWKDVKVQ